MEYFEQSEEIIEIGALVIDLKRHTVFLAEQHLALSPIEFNILAYLARRSPQVVSSQSLIRHLYESEANTQNDSAVIRTNVYRIRQKMSAISKQKDIIRTVRGVGYTLQPPKRTKETELIDGRYRLLDLLGRGATSTVYLADQVNLDRYVAIKFLRATLQENDTFRERFHQEARHAANLQHPNLVQVYDFGQSGASHYIVMEYIEGQTLENKLEALEYNNQKLSLAETIKIIKEIGNGLGYAHQQGMVHRDIKPENIILRPDGQAALMDFGLAKFVEAPHMTAEGEISGTPNYMAPEHIQGATVDTRVDIYGIGVLMFRMITGRLPFIADTEIGVLFQHIKEAPPRPSLFSSDLDPGIELVILKALAKEPAKRYQTMEALLADLERPHEITTTFEELLPDLKPAPIPPHYLPVPLTPFVRRTKELNSIQSRLMQPSVRLLTLLGFGGVGKTRLGLEVARNMLLTFADGVFFIDLTAVKSAAFLPSAIAHIIQMNETGSKPVKEQLLSYLQSRQILLLMDNFEHILEAATLVNEILAIAPQCKILATSREPLRLYGENLIRVNPLSLPEEPQDLSFETLSQFAAVQLFASRAEAANPDFHLGPDNVVQVARLCIQLDGLPLALELAASQVYGASSLAEIESQLSTRLAFLTDGPRDHSARQQTMRGAIDWSYALLSEQEQQGFSRLAVFSGRFTPQAAAEIIGAVDLKGLARKSLLQEQSGADGQTNYVLLQVLAEYAQEKLEEVDGLAELQKKHTDYYLQLVRTAEPHLSGANPSDWFKQLDDAHDNFRAILHRSLRDQSFDTALQITSVLWRLWAVYSYLSEGGLWLEETLALTQANTMTERAKSLYGAGRIALFQQNLALARKSFDESLEIYTELKDVAGQAAVLNSLGEIAIQQDDFEQANSHFEEALLLFRNNDNHPGTVQSLTNLAHLALHKEQYERANALLLESLDLEEKMGRPEATAIVLNGLGEVARIQNRISEAAVYYERALDLYQQINYSIGQAVMLHNLGQLNLVQKRFQTAMNLFRESLKVLRLKEEKVFVAWNLAGIGSAILNLGNPRHAVLLFSVTQSLLDAQDGRLDILDQEIYDHSLEESKRRLSEVEWQQAWKEGQTIPVENELLEIITLTPALPPVFE